LSARQDSTVDPVSRSRPRSGDGRAARLLERLVTTARPSLGLTIALLRIASGAIFVIFGVDKFTAHGSEASSFAKYGLPHPGTFAYVIGAVELIFGLLLLAGLGTRLAALVLAGDMVGVISTAGRVEGGALNLGLAPALLVVMLLLVLAGAGRWSLDERLGLALRARRLAAAPHLSP
jgi:putative oxidoreductase